MAGKKGSFAALKAVLEAAEGHEEDYVRTLLDPFVHMALRAYAARRTRKGLSAVRSFIAGGELSRKDVVAILDAVSWGVYLAVRSAEEGRYISKRVKASTERIEALNKQRKAAAKMDAEKLARDVTDSLARARARMAADRGV